MSLEASFTDRKAAYYAERGEVVNRAAYLSPSVTAVSFSGRGNRLSFLYDPSKVDPKTNYKGAIIQGISIIEDSAFAPGIIDFYEAMRIAQEMFTANASTSINWYEKPEITRDSLTDLRVNHPRREQDRLFDVVILEREA